jgi:hypothetical protein
VGQNKTITQTKMIKTNHFDGHLDGLKHRQIRSRYPIVNLLGKCYIKKYYKLIE